MKKRWLCISSVAVSFLGLVACNNKNNEAVEIKEEAPVIDYELIKELESGSFDDFSNNQKITLDCLLVNTGNYNANFTKVNVNDIDFFAYRAGKTLSTIYPDSYLFTNEEYCGKDGAIFNIKPIDDILGIRISYSASDNMGIKNPKAPNITFGKDNKCSDIKYDLVVSSRNVTKFVNVSKRQFDYFSINTGDYMTEISKIEIVYTQPSIDEPTSVSESGKGLTRVNPVEYEGKLVAGQSKVSVPTNVEYDSSKGKYVATEKKELTYYTLDYVKAHPEVKDDASMITPEEVSMYYTAFKAFPANYTLLPSNGSRGNIDAVVDVFGYDARYVSKYNRTDGYAVSIPWSGDGYYYEFDINIDGNYVPANITIDGKNLSKNRGSGRVVGWEKGFDAKGYDDSIVCLYTDDHYASWLEYYNDGSWSNRYNGEQNITGVSFSPAQTVSFLWG